MKKGYNSKIIKGHNSFRHFDNLFPYTNTSITISVIFLFNPSYEFLTGLRGGALGLHYALPSFRLPFQPSFRPSASLSTLSSVLPTLSGPYLPHGLTCSYLTCCVESSWKVGVWNSMFNIL